MPNRTVTIEIKTLSDLAALTKTIAAMDKMSRAAQKLNDQWSNAADAKTMASAIKSIGTSLENIATHGPEATKTVKGFTTAMKNLDKALAGVPIELKSLAAAIRQTADSTKSWNDQNKALNKQSEVLTEVTQKLDRYGRVRERLTTKVKSGLTTQADGTETARMTEQLRTLEKFDEKGKLISKTLTQNAGSGGIGAWSTNLQKMSHTVQTVTSSMAPFLRVLNLLKNAIGGIGTRAWSIATRAINTFGTTAASLFARLRSSLAASGGLFTAFHKRVEDSMARSKRATIDFLNSGWSFLTSGYTTRAFGQGMLQKGGGVLTDYMDFERNVVRTAVAGSTDPETIRKMVFGMQRGSFGQQPIKQFSAEEIADMAYYYASAIGQQITGENMQDLAPVLANFLQIANVTRTAPEVVTKGIINAATEFGIDPRDVQNIPELQNLGTQMAYLSNISTLEFPDIAESFKMVGPLASQLGASPQDAMALLYLMSEAGLRGGQAGRGISQTFSRLLDPTDKMLGLSEQYGMTPSGTREQWHQLFFDESGQLRGGVQGMLSTIKSTTENPQQMAQIVAELFSENATRALVGSLSQLFQDGGKFQDIIEELTGNMPTDWLGRAVEENNDSLSASFAWLKAAWFQVTTAMVTAIQGPLMKAFDSVTKVLFKFSDALTNNPGIARFLAGLFAIIGAVTEVIGTLFIGVGSILLMAKAFSLTSGFGLRFVGVILGIASTFARLMPTLLLASAVTTAFVVAWQQDFLGVATFFRSLDLVSIVDEAFRDISKSLMTFGQAWKEFITLIMGGEGTTNNLRTVLEGVFGEFLGTIVFGQILRLRDAVHGLYEELSNLGGVGRGIDLGGIFSNLGPTMRGLTEYATTGILGADVDEGSKFFDALGFSNGFETFVATGQKLREIMATLQAVFINFKNAIAPSLEQIYTNFQRIIAVLTNGQVVLGGFGGVLVGVASGLIAMSNGIAVLTGLVATLVERFRGLAPIIGAVAGIIASTFIAKAIIPFDKQLFHATATVTDFVIKVLLIGGLQAVFIGLEAVARVAFATIVTGSKAAVEAIFELMTGMAALETTSAMLELIGQSMTMGFLTGVPAMAIAIAGIIVLIGAIGIAIYQLWKTNEGFRDRMIETWEAIKGILTDFITGFAAGFLVVFINGLNALVAILMVFADAFSYAASTVLPFIDRLNAATLVGAIFGAAIAAWSLALGVSFVSSVANAVISLGTLIAQFIVFSGSAIVAAISATIAWLAALAPIELIALGVVVALGAIVAVLIEIGAIQSPFGSLTEGLTFAINAAKTLYDYLFKVNNETQADKAWKDYQKAEDAFTSFDPQAEAQKKAQAGLAPVLQVLDPTKGGALTSPTNFGGGEYSVTLEKMYKDYLDSFYKDPANTGIAPADRRGWFAMSGGEKGWTDFFAQRALPQEQSRKEALLGEVDKAGSVYDNLRNATPEDFSKDLYSGGGGVQKITGIKPLDEILSGLSFENVAKKLGINMDQLTSGVSQASFPDYESYQEARKAEAVQKAIEDRYLERTGRRLEDEYKQLDPLHGPGRLRGGAEGAIRGPDQAILAEVTKEVTDELSQIPGAAEAAAQAFADFSSAFQQSIASIDLAQGLKGVYGPYAGRNRTSAAEVLYGYSDTILKNLQDTVGSDVTLPWQNQFELMADAAGTGGFLGKDMTGKNLQKALRPYLETFASQSGVDIDSLMKDIPMFYAPEQYVGMGQTDLLERINTLTPQTYQNLDLLGSGQYGTQMFDAEGFDWTEFANFGTAQAAAGNLDWNLTDYIMEAWDMTKSEAEAYIKANHLDPDILGGDTFADTKLYADSLGGQVNVMTEEWMDYYNQVTKNGTDKTVEITQAAFDRLPDIVKIGYSNMGVQFVISGDKMNNELLTTAQATKDTIEDTYGNIPDHLEKLLKPKTEGGGGWSTSLIDGIVTIYDDLGNIKFTMPEADYAAWQESIKTIEEIMDGLKAKTEEYNATLLLIRGGAFNAPGQATDYGSTGSGRRRGGATDSADTTETGSTEPLINVEDMFPGVEDIQAQADAISSAAVTSITTALTTGMPVVSATMDQLVQAVVLAFAPIVNRLGPLAQSAITSVSGTLYGGVPQVRGAGYALGSAAGDGVLQGLNSKLAQIRFAAGQIVQAATVGNNAPIPAPVNTPPLPFGIGGGGTSQQSSVATGTTSPLTGGRALATSGSTVSVQIGTVNASSEQDVRSMLTKIDEGLGNKFDLARRGMYATA